MWRDDLAPSQRYGFCPLVMTSLCRLYAALPIPSPPEQDGDELTVQLTALGAALKQDSTLPLAAELVNEHLARWLPGFVNAVTATTSHPFYRHLAGATSGWLDDVRLESVALWA